MRLAKANRSEVRMTRKCESPCVSDMEATCYVPSRVYTRTICATAFTIIFPHCHTCAWPMEKTCFSRSLSCLHGMLVCFDVFGRRAAWVFQKHVFCLTLKVYFQRMRRRRRKYPFEHSSVRGFFNVLVTFSCQVWSSVRAPVDNSNATMFVSPFEELLRSLETEPL